MGLRLTTRTTGWARCKILSPSARISRATTAARCLPPQLIGDPSKFTGIYAPDKVDLFNILCIPRRHARRPENPTQLDSNVDPNAIFSAAVTYCKQRRAF